MMTLLSYRKPVFTKLEYAKSIKPETPQLQIVEGKERRGEREKGGGGHRAWEPQGRQWVP